MEELKQRIKRDGKIIGNKILKVDTFLNHQIEPSFILRMGKRIADMFANEGVTKILTVEASGIAIGMGAGLALDVPVVFAKKKRSSTQSDEVYKAPVFSFTRQEAVDVCVAANLIQASDVVLIVDDFLAHGEALKGLISIVEQAGAKFVGAAIVIEKRFQNGAAALREQGIRIEALAAIDSMEQGNIIFAD